MPNSFMGTTRSRHISLADLPLTRTNLIPTGLYCNLMLQERLGDSVSRETAWWPCFQVTLRGLLLTGRGKCGDFCTVYCPCLAVWMLKATQYLWGDSAHVVSQDDVQQSFLRSGRPSENHKCSFQSAGWLQAQPGQPDHEALLETLPCAFVKKSLNPLSSSPARYSSNLTCTPPLMGHSLPYWYPFCFSGLPDWEKSLIIRNSDFPLWPSSQSPRSPAVSPGSSF